MLTPSRRKTFRPNVSASSVVPLKSMLKLLPWGGEPRHGPTHALLVGLDVHQWRARHEDQGGVASVQLGEVADIVDKQRAAVAQPADGQPWTPRANMK